MSIYIKPTCQVLFLKQYDFILQQGVGSSYVVISICKMGTYSKFSF